MEIKKINIDLVNAERTKRYTMINLEKELSAKEISDILESIIDHSKNDFLPFQNKDFPIGVASDNPWENLIVTTMDFQPFEPDKKYCQIIFIQYPFGENCKSYYEGLSEKTLGYYYENFLKEVNKK